MADNPYSGQSASGYNSSPPADDGSEVASNQVKWSTIKSKLTDTLKTFIEAVDSAISDAFDHIINIDNDQNNQMGGSLAFAPSELTISGGVVTPTRSHHSVDTQSDASNDILDTISTASVSDGCILNLYLENAGRTVTVTHEAGGAGQVHLLAGFDYELDSANKTLTLQRRGADWYQVAANQPVKFVQIQSAATGAVATGTTAIPYDDTIPQNNEGDEYMTLAITPINANNKLVIDVVWNGRTTAASNLVTVALFQDSTADALAAVNGQGSAATSMYQTVLRHIMTAGTTSETTFKVRAGSNSGTTTFNGVAGAREFGGVIASSISVTEYLP